MLKSFTRNYEDNSTDAGFQFTFYCDVCNNGHKSSFVQSETYKKKKGLRGLSQGVAVLGQLVGGRIGDIGYSVERGGDILSERFEGMSPEWQKEHEKAFERAQNEAQGHFHRCHSCNIYTCDSCFNEDEGLCTDCAPRQEVYVAKARAEAMQRNIDEAGNTATVWKGKIESKTTICSACGKPAGTGKFCNNCGRHAARKTHKASSSATIAVPLWALPRLRPGSVPPVVRKMLPALNSAEIAAQNYRNLELKP